MFSFHKKDGKTRLAPIMLTAAAIIVPALFFAVGWHMRGAFMPNFFLQNPCSINADYCPPGTSGPRERGDWETIKQAVAECRVESIFQTHALMVSAILKDGTRLSANEPAIDDIFAVVNEARPKCGNIGVATE